MLTRDHFLAFISRPGDTRYEEILLGGTASTGGQILLVLFTGLVVLINLLLVLLVLSSPLLRSSTKHLLVLNIAVGDLLVGILICPLLLEVSFTEDWVSSCHTLNTLTLFKTSLVPSATSLALFLVNLFYILRITRDDVYIPKRADVIMPVCLGLCVWLLSIIVLVPLYFAATSLVNSSEIHQCSRVVEKDTYAFLYISLSYIPQSFAVAASACLMAYTHTPDYLTKNLLFYGEIIQVPLDAVLATFITLACHSPFFILEFISVNYECRTSKECRVFHMGGQVTVWLLLAKSFLLPLCWLACRDVRRALKAICGG